MELNTVEEANSSCKIQEESGLNGQGTAHGTVFPKVEPQMSTENNEAKECVSIVTDKLVDVEVNVASEDGAVGVSEAGKLLSEPATISKSNQLVHETCSLTENPNEESTEHPELLPKQLRDESNSCDNAAQVSTTPHLKSDQPKPASYMTARPEMNSGNGSGADSSSDQDSSSDSDNHTEHFDDELDPESAKPMTGFIQHPKAGPLVCGESTIYDLPPIEDLVISISDDVPLVELGHVQSIVDCLVIIKASHQHSPLDEDTVLFMAGRKPLGRVYEVFGPVVSPYYNVRFNTGEDINNMNVKQGDLVYYAPVEDKSLTNYVFLSQVQKIKGSDSSWLDNHETPPNHQDYSDDEAERLASSKQRAKSHKPTSATDTRPPHQKKSRVDGNRNGSATPAVNGGSQYADPSRLTGPPPLQSGYQTNYYPPANYHQFGQPPRQPYSIAPSYSTAQTWIQQAYHDQAADYRYQNASAHARYNSAQPQYGSTERQFGSSQPRYSSVQASQGSVQPQSDSSEHQYNSTQSQHGLWEAYDTPWTQQDGSFYQRPDGQQNKIKFTDTRFIQNNSNC